MSKNKLLLIDSSALIYRAFYALPPLTDKKNRTVNAVYGFLSAFINVLKKTEPTHIVFAFDAKGGSFRNKKYPEYKAQREKAPDDLYSQIPLSKKAAASFGFPCLDKEGFEADDIIGFLANKFLDDNSENEVVIATGDLDTLQLVGPRLSVFSLSRGINDAKIYDEKAVKERFGLEPKQMIDYKALFGDNSDNIKGVKGIGQKTASDLLQKHHSLENIYRHLEELKPQIKNKLEAGRESAFLSQELVTLAKEVPVEIDWNSSLIRKEEIAQGGEYLEKEFDFRSLRERVLKAFDLSGDGSEQKNNLEQKKQDFSQMSIVELEGKISAKGKEFIVWTEKTEKGSGIFFADIEEAGKVIFCPRAKIKKELLPILKEVSVFCFDSQNIFREYPELEFVQENFNDLKLITYLIHPPFLKKFSFKETVWHFLKIRFEEPKKQLSLLGSIDDNYPLNKLKEVFTLLHKLVPEVKGAFQEQIRYQKESSFKTTVFPEFKWQAGIDFVFQEIEKPLSPVLAEIERVGVKVDLEMLNSMNKKNGDQIKILKEKIFQLAGQEFNLDSPSQLADILYSKLGIPSYSIKKGKAGHHSTAADILEQLTEIHPIAGLLLEYREKRKLQTTYLETLPSLISQKDGRIHASFDPTGTATGRLSSANPNLQNIPLPSKKDSDSVSIRKAFIPEDGYSFISLDYSQIEIRIAAYLTGEKKLIEAFEKDLDIHQRTASLVKNIPLEEVTPAERSAAKALNFGIMYGISPFGFARSSKMSESEAKIFIDNYLKEFPKISSYMENIKSFVNRFGFVETIFGRRRYFPEATAKNRFLRQSAERMAINMPFQGTAADIMKMALINTSDLLKSKFQAQTEEEAAKIILTIHDEIILEVKDELVESVKKQVKETMESVIKEILPLKVDVAVGKNWEEL